jgi:hypothetical protein
LEIWDQVLQMSMSWGAKTHYSRSSIKNPYSAAFPPLWGLVGLSFLSALITVIMVLRDEGNQPVMPFLLVATGLFFLSGLTLLITWSLGQIKARQMNAFLHSARPLLRWSYTPEEWRPIRETRWQEEREDWRVQLGCLTLLFGVVGLLTGLLIGAEEGLMEAIEGSMAGTLLGGAVGGLIGGAVAGGNHLAARKAYRQATPEEVALAPHEILANGEYFKGDGTYRYIQRAHLEPGSPPRLVVKTWSPRLRGSSEEEWVIVVPPRLAEEVAAILPQMVLTRPDADGV